MPKSIRAVLEKLRDSEISCMTDKRNEAREQRIISALKDLSEIVLAEKKPLLPLATDYRFGKTTQHGIFSYNEAIDHISNIILGG